MLVVGVAISLSSNFIAQSFSNLIFVMMIFCAVFAKYKVIKNFEAALDRSDEALELLGGKNN